MKGQSLHDAFLKVKLHAENLDQLEKNTDHDYLGCQKNHLH